MATSLPTEAEVIRLLDALFERCKADNKLPRLFAAVIDKLSKILRRRWSSSRRSLMKRSPRFPRRSETNFSSNSHSSPIRTNPTFRKV